MKAEYKTVDEYIKTFPEGIQIALQGMRQTIHEAAPEAMETISWHMPTFKLNGILVSFAAHKKHVGFYPTSSGIERFSKELSRYKTSKGAVQFPLDKPIPFDLVKKIVTFRVKEQLQKKKQPKVKG